MGCMSSNAVNQPNTKQILLRRLLVESSWYPAGWRQDSGEIKSDPPNVDVENIHVTYRYSDDVNNVSVHELLRYESIEDAKNDLEARIKHMKSYEGETFTLSTNSKYTHLMGVFRTKRDYGFTLYVAAIQYDTYVSIFSAHIRQNSMTESDFISLVDKIDTKMTTTAGQSHVNLNAGERGVK